MKRYRQHFLMLAGLLLLASLGINGSAAVIVGTSVEGTAVSEGDQFDVIVEVIQNDDPSSIPVACSFRVNYSTSSVDFISTGVEDLGEVYPSTSDEGIPPSVFRDVAALGDFSNTDLTPRCFKITFEVITGHAEPFTISIEDDPIASKPLLNNLGGAITHSFNNTNTTNLSLPIYKTRVEDWMLMP